MHRIFISSETQNDTDIAAEWYESQSKGLGERFLDKLNEVYAYIEYNPHFFPIQKRKTRRAVVDNFPSLFYL
jgi:Mn-dependent DtxR family transcriptional regulator